MQAFKNSQIIILFSIPYYKILSENKDLLSHQDYMQKTNFYPNRV